MSYNKPLKCKWADVATLHFMLLFSDLNFDWITTRNYPIIAREGMVASSHYGLLTEHI